jgi:hypothetical protein
MNEKSPPFAEGGCTCGAIRYRLESTPLFVHCCHCRWCQRETGASYALNALIEADRVTLTLGEPTATIIPTNSGKEQNIFRCPDCFIAVWSNYAGAGDAIRFVRIGTLDNPDLLPPDLHIYTLSKQPWVELPEDAAAVDEYYSPREYWTEESRSRWKAANCGGPTYGD